MTRLFASLLLGLVVPGLAVETVPLAGSAGASAGLPSVPADTLLDIGDRHLEIEIRRGTEPVAIVFENGGGASLDDWGTVPDSIAAHSSATIVRYNRAGTGRSELGPDGHAETLPRRHRVRR